MAKNAGKNASAGVGAYYVILIGIVILLIGFYAMVFGHTLAVGAVMLLIGVLISVLGLSNNSLRMLKKSSKSTR